MAPETPKGVSSRLLTMKFMQRAAASGSSAGTPDSATQNSKKRKLDNSKSEGRLSLNMDQAAVQAAINEQQATRQAALDRHVTGDTHWVLNTSLEEDKPKSGDAPPLRVRYIGYGDIDSGDESGGHEDEAQVGRTSTSNYKQAKSKKHKIDAAETNGDHDGFRSTSDDSQSESETSPARQSSTQGSRPSSRNDSRSRSQSRHRSESAKAKELRDKRKKKDVHLSKLTSISSGGNKNFSPQSGRAGSKGGRR